MFDVPRTFCAGQVAAVVRVVRGRVQGVEVEVLTGEVADASLAVLVRVDGSGLHAARGGAVLVAAEAAVGLRARGARERERRPVRHPAEGQEAREVVRDQRTVDTRRVPEVVTRGRRDPLRVERQVQVVRRRVRAGVVAAVDGRLVDAHERADTVGRRERVRVPGDREVDPRSRHRCVTSVQVTVREKGLAGVVRVERAGRRVVRGRQGSGFRSSLVVTPAR